MFVSLRGREILKYFECSIGVEGEYNMFGRNSVMLHHSPHLNGCCGDGGKNCCGSHDHEDHVHTHNHEHGHDHDHVNGEGHDHNHEDEFTGVHAHDHEHTHEHGHAHGVDHEHTHA